MTQSLPKPKSLKDVLTNAKKDKIFFQFDIEGVLIGDQYTNNKTLNAEIIDGLEAYGKGKN